MMSKKFNNKYILILILIFFSFLIRLVYLTEIPNGFFIDEASFGYNSYSITQTGNDLFGNHLPLYTQGFSGSDAINPIFTYSMAFFIKLLGISVFSVRFTSAFWGTLTVIGTYLIVSEMFDKKTAIFSTILVSVSPWAFHYSRLAFDAVTTPPLILFGLFFLIRGIKKSKHITCLLGSCLFSLSTYTYGTAKLFFPLLLIGFYLIYWRFFSKNWKITLVSLLITLLIITPVYYKTFNMFESSRFNNVSIFSQSTLLEYRSQLNSRKQNNSFIKYLAQSDNFIYFYAFAQGYIKHFGFDFLFLSGDSNLRHSISGFGQLYLFELPLILGGIILLMRNRSEETWLLILWVLIFPIASSITKGVPHATRSLVVLPVFQIIVAHSLTSLITWLQDVKIKKKIIKITVLIILFSYILVSILNVLFYFYSYFYVYPHQSTSWFDYGFEDAFNYAVDNKINYDKVYISNRMLWPYTWIHMLFFLQHPPSEYQAYNSRLDPFYDHNLDGNYKICNIEYCPQTKGKFLYIETLEGKNFIESHPEFNLIETIKYPSGEGKFYIIERIQ